MQQQLPIWTELAECQSTLRWPTNAQTRLPEEVVLNSVSVYSCYSGVSHSVDLWSYREFSVISLQRREDWSLQIRWICLVSGTIQKVDLCCTTTPLCHLPEGHWWWENLLVGRTLSITPGCSLYLERERQVCNYTAVHWLWPMDSRMFLDFEGKWLEIQENFRIMLIDVSEWVKITWNVCVHVNAHQKKWF